jgi:hypothetical protein
MLETLDDAGLLLGVRPEETYTASEFKFEKGDRLLLYSDGLTEAENAVGLSFGDLSLPMLFASRQSYTAEHFADALLKDVLAWSTDRSWTRSVRRHHICRRRSGIDRPHFRMWQIRVLLNEQRAAWEHRFSASHQGKA